MLSSNPRMTLVELYQSHKVTGSSGENARALLAQTHWFSVNVNFDPKTGEALPQRLSAFLAKAVGKNDVDELRDRLWRITEHARPSVKRLTRALNESPRREHALLPVRAVRELDANSFVKLSNRPGRTIREKLASKPYLQAVRCFQSVNLPENQLFKAFVTRLAEHLLLRQDCLGEEEDELLPTIHLWLRSDEAQAIARWENLPPNNALLSHRDYRRVWDAWRWLQTLDSDIARDFSTFESREITMRRWIEYGQMYLEGTVRFADMPVLFDYDTFEIRPWSSALAIQKAKPSIARSFEQDNAIDDPVCVDLGVLRPRYASTTVSAASLHDAFLWQQWQNESDCVDIALFDSDAVYLHPEATSIASSDLFFSDDSAPVHLDRAARAFAAHLCVTFRHDTLIWLVPDVLNDFELEITRRNLNARFPGAEPLPRSVAAAFEQVDYTRITNDGYPIVVVDTFGSKTCVTKLIARLDPELTKHLPDTNGYYWERCPPVILPAQNADLAAATERPDFDMMTVDDKGQWRDGTREHRPPFIEQDTLKRDPRIGQFAFCINLSNSPVAGGIRLHALRQRAGDIPLWRDQVPELSIKVMKDGRYQRFYLVARGTTVKPLCGLTVRIPVEDNFTLPAGRPHYQFPLFQGESGDEVGFSARLDSPAFPLKADAVCTLDLAFAYGADEPYTLIFSPLDKAFPPIRATWRRTVDEIVTDAPAPEYPRPMSWGDLREVPKPGSGETSNMLEWVLRAVDTLWNDRTVGEIHTHWREDRNGNRFALGRCEEVDHDIFIHEHEFVNGCDYTAFEAGDQISFELHEDRGRFRGRRVAGPHYDAVADAVTSIRKGAYVPFIQIWKDGRSISDRTCPREFAKAAEDRIAHLANLLDLNGIPPRLKNELLFLLSCLHKDTTDECVDWITEQVDDGNILDPRAVGFALGDVSEEWQKYIFHSLAAKPNTVALRAFAYAIWREQHFVDRFALSELRATVNPDYSPPLRFFAEHRSVP